VIDRIPGGPPPEAVRAAFLESSAGYGTALAAVAARQGWDADIYVTYADLVQAVEASLFHLVVLSYTDLPPDGLDFTRVLSATDSLLVVLGTEDADLLAALQHGATLVMKKPFDPDFLALAITAILRRAAPLRSALEQGATLGDLVVRVANHVVERGGRRQVLGPGEWQLFAFLLANPEKTHTRRDLARGAWGAGHAGRDGQVELYISRLRRKLERNPHQPEVIITVRGHGYRLDRKATTSPASAAEMVASARRTPVNDYWLDAYRALVNIQGRLIDHTTDTIGQASTATREEILRIDLPLLEAEMERCRGRLAHWEARPV
jgi:DNA-binding response OmpR family regulator